MRCLYYDICKWLDIPKAPSPASSPNWLAGNVKEPTHLSQRVGNVALFVVVWFVDVYTCPHLNQLLAELRKPV